MIYTIGYDGLTIEALINKLKEYSINVLIDVRSVAHSQNNDFTSTNLHERCLENSITYVSGGKALGARREEVVVYTEGIVDFNKVPFTPSFQSGIKRLNDYITRNLNVCLMCKESNPLDCHRFSMISKYLNDNGYNVEHITQAGKFTHKEMEEYMVKSTNSINAKYAYKLINKRIGYKGDIVK